MTLRSGFCVSAALLMGIAVAAPGVARTEDLMPVNIYIWNDYLGETTLADFTRVTGYPTNVDVFDSLELLEQKVLIGKSGYDVVVPTAEPTLSRLIKAGVVEKLDKARLPDLGNVSKTVMMLLEASDPGNLHAVPYMGGTIGLGINPDRTRALMPDAPLDSWDLLFKPEVAARLAPCGITMLDSAVDVIPTVLHYLGLDPNSDRKEDHDAAEALLTSIRPHVKRFVTGQNIDMMAAGDACVVMTYSGDAIQAKVRAAEAGRGVRVEYVIPREGAQVGWDALAIPVDAPNKEGAHAFIDFLMTPEAIAGVTNHVAYTNAVPSSMPLVDEAIRTDRGIFPPPELEAKLFAVTSVSPAVDRMRNRLWTRVRTGRGRDG